MSILLLLHGTSDPVAQGISQEEYYQGTPPPPIIEPARCFDDNILLKWKQPPEIQLPRKPGYDPEVAYYRVYRINRNHEPTLIGQTEELFFLVGAPLRPKPYRYAISAVQKSGQESPLSLEIVVTADKN